MTEIKKKKKLSWGGIALFPIILLAIADAFTFAGPIYVRNIFPNVHIAMGITPGQLSWLFAAFGISKLCSQIPGGWLTDKVSSKKLIFYSLIATGILTLIWGLSPFISNDEDLTNDSFKMGILYLVYIGWGVSTTLIFWTPLWKLLSQQGKKEEQGKLYGLQGSFNGLIGFIFLYLLAIVAGLICAAILKDGLETKGYQIGFTIYAVYIAIVLFVTSVGVMLFIEEKPSTKKFSLNTKTMKEVMKNYKVWLLAFFVMGIYMLQTSLTYLNNYMANILLIGFLTVSLVGAFRTYLARAIIAAPAGHYCDKKRSYIEVLLWTLLLSMFLLVIIIMMPGFQNNYGQEGNERAALIVRLVTIAFVLSIGFLCWVMVTSRFATVVEIATPKNSHASTVALVSLVAFSSDSWFYLIAGAIQNNHQMIKTLDSGEEVIVTDQAGNQIIFGIILLFATIGFICGLTLFLINRWEHKNKNIPWRKELNNMEVLEEETISAKPEEEIKSVSAEIKETNKAVQAKIKQYNFNYYKQSIFMERKLVHYYE